MASVFVYVGNAESQDVSVLALQPDGSLTPVETRPVPGSAEPGSTTPMAVSPDKRFLYVGLRNKPYSAATFAIDAKTGSLGLVGSGPLADAMAYIATDRSGKFLLCASYGGGKIAVHPIGADGVIGAAQQVIAGQPNAHAILADAANHHVLHTSLGGDYIAQHQFDAGTGMLTPNDPPMVRVRAKAGPRHFRFSPDERFVYLLCELDGSIYIFPYDAATGRLAQETQIVRALPQGFAGKPWAADIHLTPDGKFIYASERTTSTLVAFRTDPKTGVLAVIDSYPTEQQPRGFRIDPSGRYLLTVGQLSNSLTSYAIDATTGRLVKLGQYPVGNNPNWVEIVSFP
jgi:6-phosphogluconolactonase